MQAPAQLLTPRAEPSTAPDSPAPAPQPGRSYIPPAATPRPPSASRGSAIFSEPTPTPAPPPAPAAPSRSLFGIMTRGMRGRAAAETPEPQRAEPGFATQPETPPAPVQPQQSADEALEIPAFLRRQSSS